MIPGDNDWMEYRQYIIKKLDALDKGQAELVDQVTLIRIDLAMLKVRASIWGGLAGLVPTAIGVIAVFLGGR